MDELSELFSIEDEGFQKKAKSEEEIQKWCTKDDFDELQRAVYLLKKGYEVQKLAVINNLSRYCKEIGANEQLLSLIINSLEDWDNKMQIECAKAFISPIQCDLLNTDNKQRLLKLAVQIATNEFNENEVLEESWCQVFNEVVGQVDFAYVQLVALKAIQELTDRKSPFARRKLGHRLLFSLVMQCGEAAIDEDRQVMRLVLQICGDTNYKIRTDGAIFFKEYLKANHTKLLGTNRLENTYIPEICELCNDSDIFIRIEAIEAISYILETLDEELIERELVPSLTKLLASDHEEIVVRVSLIVGQLAFKLQAKDLHLKYKEQFLDFYKAICNHKSDECRLNAAYNLPAMSQIFRKHTQAHPGQKDNLKLKPQRTITGVTASTAYDDEESKDGDAVSQPDLPFDFFSVYYQFANDPHPPTKLLAAHCIHEAFQSALDDEDTSALRDAYTSLLQDDSTEIQRALIPHLDIVIAKYANAHAICQLQDDPKEQSHQPQLLPLLTLGKSSQEVVKMSSTTTNRLGKSKLKKQDSLPEISTATADDYLYIPDFIHEQISSQLLQNLLVFQKSFTKKISLWRDFCVMWDKISQQIQKFHLPEVQDKLVQLLFDDIKKGNKQLRQMCCRCFVVILANQHDIHRRQLLVHQLKIEMAESKSFQMRVVYLQFCREAVGHLCRQFFIDNFYQAYIHLAADKVTSVRIDFAKSIFDVKPYVDSLQAIHTQMHDVVSKLKQDPSTEVVDTTDQTDFELLKARKKILVLLQEKEEFNLARQKKLDKRWELELEEKKKRYEDDDYCYDYNPHIGGGAGGGKKQPGHKTTTRSLLKATQQGQLPTKGQTLRKVSTLAVGDKAASSTNVTKRKNVTGQSKRNSSALPELNSGVNQHSSGGSSDPKAKTQMMLPERKQNEKILSNIAVGDNYQRHLPASTAVTSKYKRSNSLLAPPEPSSKPKLSKKNTELLTSPAGSVGSSAVQYNYNYQKHRVGASNKYDSGDSDGTPNTRKEKNATHSTAQSFSSKAWQN